MKVLITDTADIILEPADGIETIYFDEKQPVPSEHLDAEVLVCWGAPAALQSMQKMPNLRWVQSLAAGTDNFIAAGLPDSAKLTSGRGLHDYTVTEHAVALLLAMVRQMPDLVHAQDEHRWAFEMQGAKSLYNPERVSTLVESRVLIWGFGSIGQTLAPALTALGATVTGVAQTAGERAGFPVVSVEKIRDVLPETDVLVMILPSTPATDKVLDAELLALLPDRALVCNVGRGSTIDEEALVSALQEGTLAGAALDVMAQEPLPEDSLLWKAPNLILTPHVAGWRAHRGSELVSRNLTAYVTDEPLKNLVDH